MTSCVKFLGPVLSFGLMFMASSLAFAGDEKEGCGLPASDGATPALLGELSYPFPCLKPIVPQLGCVEQNDDATYTVQWGYNNTNNSCCPVQLLPIRDFLYQPGNFFSPPPMDRGQPIQTIMGQTGMVFAPGVHENVFSTTWNGDPLTWNIRSFVVSNLGPEFLLSSATASASAASELCTNLPPVCGMREPQVAVDVNRVAQIKFDGSASTDPENRRMTFSWNINCTNVVGPLTITDADTSTPIVRFAAPDSGRVVTCIADLQLRDVRNTTNCQQTATVQPLDCAGNYGGSAQIDQCGVCNGNNSCLDCSGRPFGTATVDRCGVCGGDGNSCVDCISINQVNNLLSIDSNAANQKAVVSRLARKLSKFKKATTADKKAAKKADTTANELYLSSWRITWTFPQVSVSCVESAFCTTQDNTSLSTRYTVNATALRSLARSLASRIAKYDRKYANFSRKDADKHYKAAIAGIKKIPTTQTNCNS